MERTGSAAGAAERRSGQESRAAASATAQIARRAGFSGDNAVPAVADAAALAAGLTQVSGTDYRSGLNQDDARPAQPGSPVRRGLR